MRGFWPVYKRELFSLFVTPLAWVLISLFLVVQGLVFYLLVLHFAASPDAGDGGPMEAFFGQTVLLYLPMVLLCPLLTMRLFAEERRSGTIECLLTTPVGTTGLVLAKWSAALTTYVAMWAPTGLYAVLLSRAGEVDWRTTLTGYLGVVLVGAGYLAIGTMASALAKSQLLAAVIGGSILVLLFSLGIGEFIVHSGPLHDVCAHVSVWTLMGEFSKGLIDSRRVVWCLTLVVVPLFVTARAVESWRWG